MDGAEAACGFVRVARGNAQKAVPFSPGDVDAAPLRGV